MRTEQKDIWRLYSEARRVEGEKVQGLERFIEWIDLVKENEVSPELLGDVMSMIERSGCPSIRFEKLLGALGISLTTACIVSSSALNMPLQRLFYIIFHELAHQYQYTKHGEEFAEAVYFGEGDSIAGARLLLKIENTADRYAYKIVKHLFEKHGLPFNAKNFDLVYKHATPEGISTYIDNLRETIKTHNLTNVHEVNELIYNMVKVKVTE